VDTFSVEQAVRAAVEAAGPSLGAVRIDSGDLPALAVSVRALLDSLGATSTRIILTGDLDEYSIAGLAVAPVDGYGVGTSLVTGSGAPTAALVYKLVARSDTPLADGEPAGTPGAAAGGQAVGGQARTRRAQVGGARAVRRGRGDDRADLAHPAEPRP
jgi:nicotinate phosphoribosyltransferase